MKSLTSWIINILIILAFIAVGFSLIGGIATRVSGAESKSHEEIYSWVKQRLGQRDLFPLPKIYILPQVQFLKVYMIYVSWEYLAVQFEGNMEAAERYMDKTLPQLRGFYTLDTHTVYIMEREDCLEEVTIAHELCNYLLHMTGQYPPPCEALDFECHMAVDSTEKLSYAIAEVYRQEFCD